MAENTPLRIHHLRPAPGANKSQGPQGPRRGVQGQDRRSWHQGHEGQEQGSRSASRVARFRFSGACPKFKGFSNALFKTTYQVVNLDRLGELFPEGGDVTVETLVAKGAVRKNQLVKVLGTGDISVALNVQAHAFSTSAKEKIAAAGGSVSEL